jgi:hypothetical protein
VLWRAVYGEERLPEMKRCVLLQVEVPVSVTAYEVREVTRIALRDANGGAIDKRVLDVQVEADVKTANKCTLMCRDVIEVDK